MKKILSFIIACAIVLSVPVCAAAEIDLSGMSWQELIDLRAAIMKEQMSRDEWQEVEVPQGVYKVGEDIPAGKWTVRCTIGRNVRVDIGDVLNAIGTEIDLFASSDPVFYRIYPQNDSGELSEIIVDLSEGQYVQVQSSSATFTPFTGKQPLGFK